MWGNCVQDVREHLEKSTEESLFSVRVRIDLRLQLECSASMRRNEELEGNIDLHSSLGGRDDLLSNPLYITPHGVYSSHKICHQIRGRGCQSHSFPLSHYPALCLSKACRIRPLNFELGDHHVLLKWSWRTNGDAEALQGQRMTCYDNAFYND